MGELSTVTAMVTGATSGIGREVAKELAARGATVVLACRNTQAAAEVAEEIREKGGSVVVGPALDLSSLESVKTFADAYTAEGRPLHILVNNAGANFMPAWKTPEGVCGLSQINYLGAYALTRRLEKRLVDSAPSRIVNVSSIMHRFCTLPSAKDLLYSPASGDSYDATKLGNVLFAYELQRRMGQHGVQACAVDPGGSNSNIYRNSATFSRGPVRWLMDAVYAPVSEGAQAVIHAATVPWEPFKENLQQSKTNQTGSAAKDPTGQLRFYARGLFAQPPMTWAGGPYHGVAGTLRRWTFAVPTLILSGLDQPARTLSGGTWKWKDSEMVLPSTLRALCTSKL